MTTILMDKILGDQRTHTYNMKNDNEVILENLEYNFLDDITVTAQGNTVSIAFCGIQTILKFTNISDLNAISLIVHDTTIGGYTGTFKTLFEDAHDSYLYTINKNTITGTVFNDTITVTDEMLDDKFKAKNIGFNITSDKGDDSISATSYNDTITGGAGTNIINLSTTTAFGDDVVTLTEGEKLEFKLDRTDDYTNTETKGNDLVITVYDSTETKTDEHKKALLQSKTI